MAGIKALSPATVACTTALAFLGVVGVPAGLVIGCILLLIAGIREETYALRVNRRALIVAVAIAFGMVGLPPMPEFSDLPPVALLAGGALAWGVLTFSGALFSHAFHHSVPALLLAMLPLGAAPLIGGPNHLPLDVALIACAFLPIAARTHSAAAIRHPLMFLCGWLMLSAVLHGAWIPAALSLLASFAAVAYSLSQDPSRKNQAFVT